MISACKDSNQDRWNDDAIPITASSHSKPRIFNTNLQVPLGATSVKPCAAMFWRLSKEIIWCTKQQSRVLRLFAETQEQSFAEILLGSLLRRSGIVIYRLYPLHLDEGAGHPQPSGRWSG
jgi:hypothetical protein